jgi:hypothetical protein
MRPRFTIIGRLVLAGTIAAGVAACAGGQPASSGAIPTADGIRSVAPQAAVTPPVKAPVTIPYPYTNVWKTTTWASGTSKGVAKPGNEKGTITVQFAIDKKTGVYLVPETIKSNAGYTEVLNSAITFPVLKTGTAQVILSDNFTYVQGPYSEAGLDTYPQGQNSFDFPLSTGRTWSAAAAHISSDSQAQTGSGAFSQNDATNVAADGDYTGQTSFSSTTGSANQDNYASTTSASASSPSVYTIAEPAAGFNTLTQTFAAPSTSKTIDVTSSGKKPIPFKPGTVKVPNWYPAVASPLYADNYKVTGTATMPSQCGTKWNGKSATAVLESFSSLDPVAGEYDVNNTTYYLTSLATHQYWFACIVESYTNTTYANGAIMSAGAWGSPSSQQVGTEILIATGATPTASDLMSIPKLHTLTLVTPIGIRERNPGRESMLRR